MPRALQTFVPPHRRTVEAKRLVAADAFYATKAWRAVRKAVLTRDEWTCRYCGRELRGFDATVDHVVERARGGDPFDPANLVAACRSCNSAKGNATQRGQVWTPPTRYIAPTSSDQSHG